MKWFLRAPHWKIFLIQLSPALLIPFVLIIFFVVQDFDQFDPTNLSILILVPLLIIGSMGFHLCYLWSIGNKLQPLVPEGVNLDPKYFNLALALPFVGMVLALIISTVFLSSSEADVYSSSGFPAFPFMFFIAYMLFGLLAMVGGFYQIYFLGKLVKTLELQREIRFEEHLIECLLFWFYIVGIWFIQPKLNQFVEQLDNPPATPPPVPDTVVNP